MAEIVEINPSNFELQKYSTKDENLVPQFDIDTSLTQSSYIEFFTYDLNNNILNSNLNYQNYTLTQNSLSPKGNITQFNISPEQDLLNQGYNNGKYITYYNILNKKIGDSISTLFISEISSDRTEIRLDSTSLSTSDFINQTKNFINFREEQDYFVDFYLNLGDNNLLIANNIQLENENTDDPTAIIKLYEPLPSSFNLKNTLWIVTLASEPAAFQVDFPVEPVTFIDYKPLNGPNFAIPVKDQVNNSSQNLSYNDIISNASTSSQNQVDSLLSQSSINISVDYNNFSDFINFSSAQTRIENFYYKVGLIETYTSESNTLSNTTGSSTSKQIIESKISNVITNFDKFEYFMYYSSGSITSYPKSTTEPPYTLMSTNSTEVLTWLGSTNEQSSNFGGLLLSASNYDNANFNQLKKSIPEYLREDPANQPYDLFVDMVAQYYDNVWLYTKDITQKYNADNRLDFGVSKDLVADAIRDFGVKLYQNNFSNQELYTAFLGITPTGGNFPFPEMTQIQPPTITMVSASMTLYSSSIDNPYQNSLSGGRSNVAYFKDFITNTGSINDFLSLTDPSELYILGSNGLNNNPKIWLNLFAGGTASSGNNNVRGFSRGILDPNRPIEFITSGSGTPDETPAIKVYLTQSLGLSQGVNNFQAGLGSGPVTGFLFISGGLVPGEAPFASALDARNMIFDTISSGTSFNSLEKSRSHFSSSIEVPVPLGMEGISDFISASNDVISMDDTNKSLYKRLYHNIPYLLKSKGTLTGLRALITSYGIPDTILKISEFGGKDQVNANDYDLYFNNFNYAFNTENNFITSSWEVNNDWGAINDRPSTVQFRFKSEEFPPTRLSQSLWNVQRPSGATTELLLDYSGSGLDSGSIVNDSGSYDGSIKDPNYQVANLRFIPDNSTPNISASISLPFYNGDWWSVMVASGSEGFNLYAGNKIYNGNDGTSIGYFSSSFIAGDGTVWTTGNISNFASSSGNFTGYESFSGSLQEIRYYKSQISENVFKDYVMNPLSFEGNGVNSAPDQLIFRAALGSELDINTSSSIHPKVTGSYNITQSFSGSGDGFSNFYFNSTPSYSKNIEYFFLDQPAVGIKNRTTDKIRSENDTIPSGNTLSPFRSLAQTTEASASYTDNINYLEVAFSPQNQINDDIIGQMGHFNIGDYIGDPAQRFSGNVYPDLNNLSEEYFKKYIKQYDLVDFVRLIKFFDNSLFKMIKDFIPTRTSLASGLVVKQHLLERNKYSQPQVSFSNEYLTGSLQVESFSGGAAGVFNPYNVSFDLDYQSGSAPIQTNVSGSSTGNTFSDGDTSINGVNGTFITNAATGSTKFPFFDNYVISSSKSYVPNLWVELQDSNGNLVANAFNSGSNGIPFTTDVSGSGELTMFASSNNQFTVSNTSSNADAGLNFPPFINEGYIQTTDAIFDNGSGTPVASSSVSSLGATLTTTFPTASVITNVSASLGLAQYVQPSTYNGKRFKAALTTNATGNPITTFDGGYISASSDIFAVGGNPAISSSKSEIDTLVAGDGTNQNLTVVDQISLFSTNVSASGDGNFNPSVVAQIDLTSTSTNASDFNFSGFDDGNAYISASANGEGNYPFDDGSEIGTGIAQITTATPLQIVVNISGRNTNYTSKTNAIQFTIVSGSGATSTTFVSQSARPTLGEFQFEVFSGSKTLTPVTQIFPSASARVVSNVAFNFHTGSVTQPGNTTFIQTTIPPEAHDRAFISSISSNILNLDTHYSINSVGATATGFEFYNDEGGNTNFFISNSILDISKMDFFNLNPQYPLFPNVTQSYSITTPSISGSVTKLHFSQDEFYNGELSGSVILVTNGELNEGCEQFKNARYVGADYKVRMYNSSNDNEDDFLNVLNEPTPGHISIFTQNNN